MGSSSSAMERSFTIEHTPTPEDVFAVRKSLLTFVPVEVADLILEEAKYWPKASCSFKPEKPWEPFTDGAICCLLTPKLCDLLYTTVDRNIKTVCFEIESHDQGWCSEDDFTGPYEGSYTWFEALIVRDHICQHAAPATGGSSDNEIYYALDLRGKVEKDHDCQVITVKNPNDENSDVWDIQRNKRASFEYRSHTVIWTEDDEGDEESILIKETGRGLGRGFVRSLKMGDRIAVMVRAKYPGWVNYMKSIELDIYHSV